MFKYSALKKELKQRFGKALAVTLSAAMLVGAVPADLLGGFSSVKADDVNTKKNVWSADEDGKDFGNTIFTLTGDGTLVEDGKGLVLGQDAKITFNAGKDGKLKVNAGKTKVEETRTEWTIDDLKEANFQGATGEIAGIKVDASGEGKFQVNSSNDWMQFNNGAVLSVPATGTKVNLTVAFYGGQGSYKINGGEENVPESNDKKTYENVAVTDGYVTITAVGKTYINYIKVEPVATVEPSVEPSVEDSKEEPSVEDSKEEPSVEDSKEEPSVEDSKEEPSVEDSKEEPSVEDSKEEPSVEDSKEEPSVEDSKEEPSVEDSKEEPSVEDSKEEPSVEDSKEEPSVEDSKEEPSVEDSKEEPSVEPSDVSGNDVSGNDVSGNETAQASVSSIASGASLLETFMSIYESLEPVQVNASITKRLTISTDLAFAANSSVKAGDVSLHDGGSVKWKVGGSGAYLQADGKYTSSNTSYLEFTTPAQANVTFVACPKSESAKLSFVVCDASGTAAKLSNLSIAGTVIDGTAFPQLRDGSSGTQETYKMTVPAGTWQLRETNAGYRLYSFEYTYEDEEEPSAAASSSVAESSEAAGSSSEVADVSSEAAGASSEVAGASSEVAGASSEAAGASSEVAGASSEAAGSSSEVAGASSEAAGASSEAAGSSSEEVTPSVEPPTPNDNIVIDVAEIKDEYVVKSGDNTIVVEGDVTLYKLEFVADDADESSAAASSSAAGSSAADESSAAASSEAPQPVAGNKMDLSGVDVSAAQYVISTDTKLGLITVRPGSGFTVPVRTANNKYGTDKDAPAPKTINGVTYPKLLNLGSGAALEGENEAPKRLVTFEVTKPSTLRIVATGGTDTNEYGLAMFKMDGDNRVAHTPVGVTVAHEENGSFGEAVSVAPNPEKTNEIRQTWTKGDAYEIKQKFETAGTYGFYVIVNNPTDKKGTFNIFDVELIEDAVEASSEAGSESSSAAATESSSAAATESSSAAGSEPSSEPSSNPNPSSDKEGLLAYLVYEGEEYAPKDYDKAVYTGSAIKPVVRVYYDDKVLTEGVDYAVKYKNNTKVTEAAIITISGKGNLSGSSQAVNFTISPADLSEDVKYPAKMTVEVGQKVAPILMNGDKKLGAKDFKLENVEGSPAQMDAKYKFTAVTEEGSPAKVRVTAGPSGNYKSDSYAEIEVTVVAKGALKANKLAVDVKGAKGISFKDENKDPQSLIDAGKIVITSKDGKSSNAEGDSKLEKDTDYIVICSSDTDHAGTVKFTVVGCGAYGGSVAKSYKIDPVKGGNIAVDLGLGEDNSIEFTSSGATPSSANVTVTYTDGDFSKELTEGVDYKISYSGNKKAPAAAKAKLTFLGDYKGNKVAPVTYNVIKAKVSNNDDALMVKVPDKAYDAKNKPNKSYKSVPVVTYKGSVIKNSEYEVHYFKGETQDDKVKLDLGENTEAEISVEITFKAKSNYEHAENETKLTGSYFVRKTGENGIDLSKAKVTFYSDEACTQQLKGLEYNNGKGFYTPGAGNETDADDSVAEAVYVKVEVSKAPVVSENYKVTWLNSTEKGKATVVIEGANGSVGSKNATIAVKAKSLKMESFLEKIASNIIGNLF